MAQFDKSRKEKSTGGCSPKDSDVRKAKAAQFPSLPVHQKEEKSIRGCSPKDSYVLKAKAAQFDKKKGCSSKDSDIRKANKFLPYPVDGRGVWGCSPKYSDELKAKAGPLFSTLPLHEKLVCLTAISYAINRYHTTLRLSRQRKTTLAENRRGSYLNKEEIAMIGELDEKEAENIYENSQKNPYLHSGFFQRVLSYCRAQGLDPMGNKEFYVSTWIGEPFVDEKVVSGIFETEPRDSEILEDKERTKLLEGCESYLMKMEEVMSCSDTKFYQSDDKKHKTKSEKKKIRKKEKERKRNAWR